MVYSAPMIPMIGLMVAVLGGVVSLYVALRCLEVWRREPKGLLVALAAVVGVVALAALPAFAFFAWNVVDIGRTNAILSTTAPPTP